LAVHRPSEPPTGATIMAEVTASMVKDLRDRTGAGMMDCKKALADEVVEAAPVTSLEAAIDEAAAETPADA